MLTICGLVQGKTLAFVLPILESLINGPAKSKRKNGYGRPPSVLVLLPTRELAKQVNLACFYKIWCKFVIGSLGFTDGMVFFVRCLPTLMHTEEQLG